MKVYWWECTWKHLDCLTSGMWGQISKNTHKRSNKIFATKPNGQIFTIKTPKASLSWSRSSPGVSYLLYVVCHCVICVVECGAYMRSKSHVHELHRLHTIWKFKSVAYALQHGHDGEETIQPLWKQFSPSDGKVRLDGWQNSLQWFGTYSLQMLDLCLSCRQ